ncbi:MAG: hypothetical protein C0605_10780 [Hyphomicrobiales bacterium]|nr:MAG: hypothetical protein C0605_10780 [Hyphomicrobiales bacterium]
MVASHLGGASGQIAREINQAPESIKHILLSRGNRDNIIRIGDVILMLTQVIGHDRHADGGQIKGQRSRE